MAQAIQFDTIAATNSMDKKTYSVNFKGLMMHLLDILFGKGEVESTYYASDLSGHMQKDLGLMR